MLSRIRARNFRSFTDLQSPEFGHVNVILGPNGAGKSSIKDAISLLLSGTATGCETGIGLGSLRAIGGSAPGKRWQIDGILTVGDDAVESLSRTDDEGPRSAKQQLTESLTKCPGAKARACIEAGEFVRLDLKARQRLLADLTPKAKVLLPHGIRQAVSELLGEDHTEVEVGEIERLHKFAYDERAAAQRDVKAKGELEAPAVPEAMLGPGDDPAAVLNEVRELLATLRTEREAALGRATSKTTDVKPYADAVAKTTRELEGVRMSIGGLPTKMEISRKAHELIEKITHLTETNGEIEKSRLDLKGKLGEAEGAMRTARNALEAVKSQKGEVGCCPTCDSKLTKVNRGKLEVSLKNKVDAAGREWQLVNEQLKVAPEPKSTVALDRETDELQAKETRLASLLEDEISLSARLKEDTAKLEHAETDPGTPGDETAAAEAAALAIRITNGEEIRDELVTYIAARKAYETNLDGKAKAMQRHALLDQLVTDLGPTGIRKGCANAGMFAFHEDLNALLKPRGFTVDLRPAMDAESDPIVTVGGKPIPLGMLSDGERIAFGAAFACSVAGVTGLGIVVVDNFERLDPEAHDAVMGILAASPHQSFVLSVERDEGMEAIASDVNGENGALRMFLLRDGQLLAPGIAAEKETAA